MNKKEVINSYEGQKVAELTWPFYRYNTLLPSKRKGDDFVWLYLSLVVFVNRSRELPIANYDETVKLEAINLIKDNFTLIIDNHTLERIISNAEKDFIINGMLSESTFIFLETYENLFNDELVSMMVYQDAITGEILPFFGEKSDEEKYTNNEFKQVRLPSLKNKDPSLKSIRKAFSEYNRLKKYNSNSDLKYLVKDNYEYNKNDEGNYDIEFIEKSIKNEKDEIQDLNNYKILTLYETKEKVNEIVDVYIIDNKLFLVSRFGLSNQWFNSCLLKGGNISEEIYKEVNELEKSFCIDSIIKDKFSESRLIDLPSTLKYCQDLYKLVDPINDSMIREHVVDLDARLAERKDASYNLMCQIMEGIILKINYERTTQFERENTDFDTFCYQIKNKCELKLKNPNILKSPETHRFWKEKFKTNGKTINNFKADLTDLILKSNLLDSSSFYDTFIEDIYSIYKLRSTYGAHFNSSKSSLNLNENIKKLTKIVKVMISMI